MQSLFYTTENGKKLPIRFQFPDSYPASDKKYPTAILFFGGGWIKRNLDQFTGQAMELSRLGMVVAVPDYRVLLTDDVTLDQVINDAERAVQCVLKHADELHINMEKLVLGGASAGGHLAAYVAMMHPELFVVRDSVATVRALVLFNPVVDTVCIRERNEVLQRMDTEMSVFSPLYHITSNLPDTMIFHGTEDQVIPFGMVLEFQRKMREQNNVCEVVSYEGRRHGFFNLVPDHIEDYYSVLAHTVRFLSDRGLLHLRT